jgi:hypothetical protein
MKMDVTCSFKTSAEFQWTMRHYIPEAISVCGHYYQDIKPVWQCQYWTLQFDLQMVRMELSKAVGVQETVSSMLKNSLKWQAVDSYYHVNDSDKLWFKVSTYLKCNCSATKLQ